MRPAEEGEGLGLKFPLKGGKELNSAGMFIDRKKQSRERAEQRETVYTNVSSAKALQNGWAFI